MLKCIVVYAGMYLFSVGRRGPVLPMARGIQTGFGQTMTEKDRETGWQWIDVRPTDTESNAGERQIADVIEHPTGTGR